MMGQLGVPCFNPTIDFNRDSIKLAVLNSQDLIISQCTMHIILSKRHQKEHYIGNFYLTTMPGGYNMTYKDRNSYKHLCSYISLLHAIFQDFKIVAMNWGNSQWSLSSDGTKLEIFNPQKLASTISNLFFADLLSCLHSTGVHDGHNIERQQKPTNSQMHVYTWRDRYNTINPHPITSTFIILNIP